MSDERCDILIITALADEREALLARLPKSRRQNPSADDVNVYYRVDLPVTFPDRTTGTYSLALTTPLSMGRVNAAVTTGAAIRRWRPRYLLLVGIAAGTKANEVKLGDILLPDQIVDYELQKITDAGPEIRWRVHQADPRLRLAADGFKTNGWRRRIGVQRPEEGTPKIHVGPVATGDKVAKTEQLFEQLLADWPKLIGLEMEAGGAAEAAFQHADPPGFFMIRCVSDLGNSAKDDRWRAYACAASAAYAVGLLRSGPVPLVRAAATTDEREAANTAIGPSNPTKPAVSAVAFTGRQSRPLPGSDAWMRAEQKATTWTEGRCSTLSQQPGEHVLALPNRPRLVMHFVPVWPPDPPVRTTTIAAQRANLPPPGEDGDWGEETRDEGVVTAPLTPVGGQAGAYTMLWTDGRLEAAVPLPLEGRPGAWALNPLALERVVMRSASAYRDAYAALAIAPPILMRAALLGVGGIMLVPLEGMRATRAQPLSPDNFTLQGRLNRLDADIAGEFKPGFDALWREGGYFGSPSYDASGRWDPNAENAGEER